jgi:single-stranded-DNA-specific exonuclease
MTTSEPQSHQWNILPRIPADVAHELNNYPPILRQLLYNRGYTTREDAGHFLQAAPPDDIDPFTLLGMSKAVERLTFAIQHQEPIAIYGDYDVDGVTATALLTEALKALGGNVRPYIPNRFDEGYGLNNDALQSLKDEGIRLVVTVDCGIRSLPEAEHARSIGLDLIISDHHRPIAELPVALAVINQKQPGDMYPDKHLAGVGLAFKLVEALCRQPTLMPPQAELQVDRWLDLVALGTVADMVSLVGENRSLVRRGMDQLRQPQRQGLFSLMNIAGLLPARINTRDIGFVLGPRINAAGRLDSALAALELLLTEDVFEAGRLAQQLHIQNQDRQKLTKEIQAQAEQIAFQENPDALLLFAAHPDFNAGVVGLAASRLMETYYRPAIVASQGAEFTRGSCRSISEFHITRALDRCTDLLVRHGGHAAAAGFTVQNNNLPELITRLQAIATEQLGSLDLRPTLRIDMEIPLRELKPELLPHLDQLEPTGMDNPQAVFVSRGLQVRYSRTVGHDNSHLKLVVNDGRLSYDAIAFRQGYWQDNMPEIIDLAYTFEVKEYNGHQSLQLNVKDLKPGSTLV